MVTEAAAQVRRTARIVRHFRLTRIRRAAATACAASGRHTLREVRHGRSGEQAVWKNANPFFRRPLYGANRVCSFGRDE